MSIRTHALFLIADMTGHGGWRMWGYKTKESSSRIKEAGFFNRARNRVGVGDEIMIQVENDDEWTRMKFVVVKVDKPNQEVFVTQIEEHTLTDAMVEAIKEPEAETEIIPQE